MDLNCANYGSENTQKITSIVDGGTTRTRGTTISTGAGSVGGRFALGSSVGTTNSTHTTILASKLACPQKPPKGYIFQTLMLVCLILFFARFVTEMLRGPGFLSLLVNPAVFWAGLCFIKNPKIKADQNKLYNSTTYLEALHRWNNGYYCHRCEHEFTPVASVGPRA